jgi:hypothetical protein
MINITLRSVVAASSGKVGENKGHQPNIVVHQQF